jgi:hypothetical protein
MKKIRWWLQDDNALFVAANCETLGIECSYIIEDIFEVEDGATDKEIHAIAKDKAFSNIRWGWRKEEDD